MCARPDVLGRAESFVEERVLYKGAEATISLGTWHGFKVVRKFRAPKPYRIEPLDQALRTRRTVHEAQLLHDAKEAGVPAPTVLLLSPLDATMLLSYIEGERLRESLASSSPEQRASTSRQIGAIIARLHHAGIVHGDLTTSNMILASDRRIFLVDFGLGSYSWDSEDMGVDLLLMKRALSSTHCRIADECFQAFSEGYREGLGEEKASENLRKIREIERRGRYVERTLRL
ncbi:MAG: Kae1-associated kinase Bud32 [Candidatus Bathyarchaeia archaeon]